MRDVRTADRLNAEVDHLRAIWLALHANGLLAEDMVEALANTLSDSIQRISEVADTASAKEARQ